MSSKQRIRLKCLSARKVSTQLLLSFLALSAPAASLNSNSDQAAQIALPPLTPGNGRPQIESQDHDFTLRHIFHHGTYQDPKLHKRLDANKLSSWVEPDGEVKDVTSQIRFHAKSRAISIQRLADRRLTTVESHLSIARDSGHAVSLDSSAWTVDDVSSPNVTDKDTVISLARMAGNAYVQIPGEGEWEDANEGFNYSQSFGWENDGLRGHIFVDESNSTVVIAVKGTSAAVFDGDQTTTNDKVNDNLFFSCCCGQGGQYFWRQVCDCSTSTYTCNETCLVKALKEENRYYRAGIELYTNVTALYPNSQVWLTGHSLGGAVSSLLGMTFGLPIVTFEAPGEALAASRLGLPAPPEYDAGRPQTRRFTGAYHFGHTADPVFMGTCNGATATCTLGGYAMESQCHTGLTCVYDTVGDLGWRVGIGNHKVHNVIDNVIIAYENLPICEPDSECVDCFNWKYFEGNGSDTTTSTGSSTSSSTTRTTTCQTPGWWGCRDETTTTTTTTTSSTSSTTTSTCETPGWFGCNDPTSTTTTISSSNLASSSTCQTPGWFGCKDPTTTSSISSASPNGRTPSITTTRIPPPTAPPSHHPPPSTSKTLRTSMPFSRLPSITKTTILPCATPFWFWCYDKTTVTTSTTPVGSSARLDLRHLPNR